MAKNFRNIGALVSADGLTSLTDGDGAYLDYDTAGTNARIGAKGTAGANRGLVIRTLSAGAAINALIFTPGGIGTFAGPITINGPASTAGVLPASPDISTYSRNYDSVGTIANTSHHVLLSYSSGGGGYAAIVGQRDGAFGTALGFYTTTTGGSTATYRGQIDANGVFDWGGGIIQRGATLARFQNTFGIYPSAAAGLGIDIGVQAGVCTIGAWDNTTPGYVPLVIRGSFITIGNGALSVANAFGCNGNTPQTKGVSGGTLAGVIAALVANGILSS